jgi:hypothetical protein
VKTALLQNKRFFPEKNMGPDEPSGKIISNLVVYHDFPPIFAVSGISWILETIFFGFLEDVWFLKRTSLSY